ncbi:MAG: hypothetical protein OM95_13630 [Bdellovibrio sp. ArHS]|uniref:substrate-binding periplasmic protein n=1 Tax=Bdellovibrio sp. ArHS TaxID=1569284 RepID=UPI0005835CF9|nr:transporter substrate-binding domain-containing protein [Bdellovibrio sp. ArHS]KHD87622.1 MAG: hypothetical protein OM95_13630 [Bdellovibrio sp. ArHS]
MAQSLLGLFVVLLAPVLWAGSNAPTLRVVTEYWPPVTFEINGEPQGMAVELTQNLQKQMNRHEPIEVLPWPRAYHLVLNRPNVLLFTVIDNEERKNLFSFLGPIAQGEIALFARRSSVQHFPTLDKLRKAHSIGVHRETAFQNTLERQNFQKIVPVNSPISGVKMLMTGRVDLFCDDVLAISQIMKEAGYPEDAFVKVATLERVEYYYAFSKNTAPETIFQWKAALEKTKRSGEFKTLYRKWFGKNPAPEQVTLRLAEQGPAISEEKPLWAELLQPRLGD